MAVARGLRDQLALLPVHLVVDQHGGLRRVPVVRVVRRGLEVPGHLARVGVDRDDRAGKEVVAGPVLVRDDRLRVAGGDEDEVQLRVVGDRLPGHAAAVGRHLCVRPGFRARLALLLRHGVEAPLHLAAFGMHGLDVAGDVEIVAADADDHVILDDRRRGRRVVEAIDVADLLPPAFAAVLHVERDQEAVRRFEVQPVLVDRHAPVAQVIAARRLPLVVPELTARPRVHRPDVIGNGEIQHAVDQQRRALDRHAGIGGAKHPGEAELMRVGRRDLRQRAEPAAGVVAVERRPAIGAGLQQLGRIEARLRRQPHRGGRELTRDKVVVRFSFQRLQISHHIVHLLVG